MRKALLLCAATILAAGYSLGAHAADGQALQIIVSINQQKLNVYDGDKLVATSHISSGKPGHDTPTGVFSVLEKQKFHRSNKYSNAPMPWMQRITWSGVALHESNSVPNRPASHGCVRMPAEFARTLYTMTARGAHVIITDEAVMPQRLMGQSLFRPSHTQFGPSYMNDVALRPALGSSASPTSVEVAMNDASKVAALAPRDTDKRDPIYILITRADNSHLLFDVQTALNQLGFDVGEIDGASGSKTRDAIQRFRAENALPASDKVDDALVAALFKKADKPLPQNGQIIVRRDFAEVYRAPVTIEKPDVALGTHFMEAVNVDPGMQIAQWYGFSLNNRIPEPAKKRLGISTDVSTLDPQAPVQALDRIQMSDETRQKIGDMLAEGSSLTITDVESKSETGLGTNFVTLTDPLPAPITASK